MFRSATSVALWLDGTISNAAIGLALASGPDEHSDIRDHTNDSPDIATLIRATLARLAFSIGSSRLRRLFRRRRFHRAHVEIEQAFALVALFLVLLPQLDDLLQDLHVKPLALGLGKDFLLLLA